MGYKAEGFVSESARNKDVAIRGPDDVLAVLPIKGYKRAKREMFTVLLLNARHELLKRVTVSVGSLNASVVHPREVFRAAVIEAAAAIVLVHNHPSGDPEPSEDDLTITRRLCQAGEILGIQVLDHVIIGAKGTVSLRNRRLIQ